MQIPSPRTSPAFPPVFRNDAVIHQIVVSFYPSCVTSYLCDTSLCREEEALRKGNEEPTLRPHDYTRLREAEEKTDGDGRSWKRAGRRGRLVGDVA